MKTYITILIAFLFCSYMLASEKKDCTTNLYERIEDVLLKFNKNNLYQPQNDSFKLIYTVRFKTSSNDSTIEIKYKKTNICNVDTTNLYENLLKLDYTCLRETGDLEIDTSKVFMVPFSLKTLKHLKSIKY